MQFALEPPWSTVLAAVSNIATLCLGYYVARWRTRRRWKAIVHHAEHAWEGWDEQDIEQELRAYRALDPKKMFDDDAQTRQLETYRTMKETFVDIGGYIVVLHPGDAFRVQRIPSSEGKPLGKPSSVFADMNAAVQADVARDPAGFHLAITGQNLPSDKIAAFRTACLTCKAPAVITLEPIKDVTAFELLQPDGWRLIFENRRARAAFSLQCPECRKDILHESEPNG